MDRFTVHCGDCLEVMPTLPAASVDSIVTDPPYGLSFMGNKQWDHSVPGEPFWREALRVAKPGAFLLAFGGTRTFHRLTCTIEDAGWEIRDCIMWVYGAGFPKSHDVSKAIDKAAGAERDAIGPNPNGRPNMAGKQAHVYSSRTDAPLTTPATDAARQWQGWGTALKPAWEPIIVARKPLDGTVAENVLEYGTGGINVDGCRVGYVDDSDAAGATCVQGNNASQAIYGGGKGLRPEKIGKRQFVPQAAGRWPSNLIHDGSDEVVGLFPVIKQPSFRNGDRAQKKPNEIYGKFPTRDDGRTQTGAGYSDSGSAARFFYCAKASKADRDGSPHPTMKPTALMRYLCRLVTQPGGVVLDPFTGSGSTGKAAMLEGMRFIGVERDPEYAKIAEARIRAAVLPIEEAAA